MNWLLVDILYLLLIFLIFIVVTQAISWQKQLHSRLVIGMFLMVEFLVYGLLSYPIK